MRVDMRHGEDIGNIKEQEIRKLPILEPQQIVAESKRFLSLIVISQLAAATGPKTERTIILHQYARPLAYGLLLDIQTQLQLMHIVNQKPLVISPQTLNHARTHQTHVNHHGPLHHSKDTANQCVQLLQDIYQ